MPLQHVNNASIHPDLQVQCPSTLATQELEAEIFMHMMLMYSESNAAEPQNVAKAVMNAYAVNSDGKAPPR